MVIGSLYHVMNDPQHFENPRKFYPTRFLDSNNRFVNDERVCPFGLGKRYCLGKSLAEKEYFLFFVGLMQSFVLSPDPESVLPGYGIDDVSVAGLSRSVPPFRVLLQSRCE